MKRINAKKEKATSTKITRTGTKTSTKTKKMKGRNARETKLEPPSQEKRRTKVERKKKEVVNEKKNWSTRKKGTVKGSMREDEKRTG